jgi:hypothetical protein
MGFPERERGASRSISRVREGPGVGLRESREGVLERARGMEVSRSRTFGGRLIWSPKIENTRIYTIDGQT